MEFREPDVIVHCRLVDFHYPEGAPEKGFLDKERAVFGLGFRQQSFKTAVFLGVQTETVLVIRRITLGFSSRSFSCVLSHFL